MNASIGVTPVQTGDHRDIGVQSLKMSWLRTRELAIGAQPQTQDHWHALDQAGIRSVLCTSFPDEGIWCPPEHWLSARIPLNDHRKPDALDDQDLQRAIDQAVRLMEKAPALYLHCWAGVERSALVAIGTIARLEQIDLLTSLEQVRRMHPTARPLTKHLLKLERILNQP